MTTIPRVSLIFILSIATFVVVGSNNAAESDWSFTDINGVEHRPFESENTRAIVLVFIMPDCPISNYYQPTLSRLAKEYVAKGIEFYLLHSDPDVTTQAAKNHAKDFAIAAPVVLDTSQKIAKQVGATHAPQAFVIDRSGKTRYQGRIDDTYVDFGEKRPKATRDDLKDAIDAILSGQEIANPKTTPIGCHIFFDESK